MKAIKTLMAVSVFAAAGAAHAAPIATFTGSINPSIIIQLPSGYSDPITYTPTEIVSSHSGSATGVLDDSGTFTITSAFTVATFLGTDNTLHTLEALTGTWNGTTFTATDGTHTLLGCVDNPGAQVFACSALAGFTGPAVITGSITLGGGALSVAQADSAGNVISYNYSFLPSPPSVPVPGAAWLFGSGLIGVAGVARRRRKKCN